LHGADDGTADGTADGADDGASDADIVGLSDGAVDTTTPPFFDDLPPLPLLVGDGVGDVVALPALPFFNIRVAVPPSTMIEDAAATVMREKSVITTTRNNLLYIILLAFILFYN
jgi:hypothetical protein